MFQKILFTISIMFCTWVGVSYIDILANNLHSGALAFWNFFNFFVQGVARAGALSQNKVVKNCSQKKT